MLHMKQMLAGCVLALFAVHSYSTPIATAEITNNFPVAISFKFTDGGTATFLSGSAYEYLHLENKTAVQVSYSEEFGTLADVLPGAEATAKITDEGTLASVKAGGSGSFVQSMTTSGILYQVTNLSSVSVTLDMNISMELLTESSGELAWGYVDQYLSLSNSFDDGLTLLADDYISDDYMVLDGESYRKSYTAPMIISHTFDDAPYTGALYFESINYVMAESQSPEVPTKVPEPGVSILLVMGIGLFAGSLRFRKVNAD